MSDTPQTDALQSAVLRSGGRTDMDIYALARKLERERDEARRELATLRGYWRSSITHLEGCIGQNERNVPGSPKNEVLKAVVTDLWLDYETAGAPEMRAVPVGEGWSDPVPAPIGPPKRSDIFGPIPEPARKDR